MKLRDVMHALAPALSGRSLLAELAGQLWLAEPRVVEAAFADLATITAAVRPSMGAGAEAKPYRMHRRSAMLSLRGVMIPSGPRWLEAYGYAISENLVERIQAAQDDADVDDILMEVDTPGGAVLGTQALAEAVATSRKPVTAHVLHMCASAGLHVTSQASRIIARRGALIGSIGTYAILVDSSAYAEEQGIKVHVIKAGEHKGVGTWGAPITEAQLAEIQSRVDRAAATFVAAVASGRRMSVARVQALATGATWEADEAMSLGLIDEIETMGGSAAQTTKKEKVIMSISKEEHEAALARIAALEASHREKDSKLVDLGGQLGSAKARAEKSDAALEGFRATTAEREKAEKMALIDEAAGNEGKLAGRVSPASRAAVERFSATATVDELRGYLAELPVLVRPRATGHGGGKAPEASASSGRKFELSEDDRKVLQASGLTEAELGFYADAKCIRADGVIEMRNGKPGTPPQARAGGEV